MWHNHLFKSKNLSYSNKRENSAPIFTGYYGVPNQIRQEQYVQCNSEKGWRAPHAQINRSFLYQKTSIRKNNRQNLNRQQLYEKYKSQKKAETDFYALQNQISQTETLIASNPHLTPYYVSWIQQAKETLKEYANIIESPDNVSFSSVYGYSKDEELITLYRNPQFSSELKRIQKERMERNKNMIPNFNRYSTNSNYYNNSSKKFSHSLISNFNYSNRSLQLVDNRNKNFYFRNVISNDDCQNF